MELHVGNGEPASVKSWRFCILEIAVPTVMSGSVHRWGISQIFTGILG